MICFFLGGGEGYNFIHFKKHFAIQAPKNPIFFKKTEKMFHILYISHGCTPLILFQMQVAQFRSVMVEVFIGLNLRHQAQFNNKSPR